MANPLYSQLMQQSGQGYMQQPMMSGMQFANPIQKMQYIMQAMTNPAQFVKQHIPDIPENIQNNPNQILQYLQKTRGISNQQIQQVMNSMPPGMR